MKTIGRGWQYEVYDLGNGRVLKKRYFGLLQFLKIYSYLFGVKGIVSIAYTKSEQRRVTDAADFSEIYIKELLKHDSLDILGNPFFHTDGSYEQDYGTPLLEILKKKNLKESEKILNNYVVLIKETWCYGFADTVFKFQINNGIRKDGRLIQLDFGEITTDKEKVKKNIKEKRWLQTRSVKQLGSKELREYYCKLTENELTESELERLWGSKLERKTLSPHLEKIIYEYESGLVIPEEKPAKQYLLCPVGLIGSGKTTAIKMLAERLSLLRLSNDEMRKVLYDNEDTLTIKGDDFTALMSIVVHKYLKRGYSIAFDADCSSESTQKLVRERETTYHIPAYWIHINPPEHFIFEVGHKDKPTWLFKDKETLMKNYEAKKESQKNLSLPFMYTLDPSKADFEKQIDELVILLQKKTN